LTAAATSHLPHDPTFAIRLGCADTGLLAQFVAVPKKAKRYNSEKKGLWI